MTNRFKTIGIWSALLVTGAVLIPQNAEARPPRGREVCGVVQVFDRQMHTVTIQTLKQDVPVTFAIKRDTRFIRDLKFTDAGSLKNGSRACVYYHRPFFGKPFVTRVVWQNGR